MKCEILKMATMDITFWNVTQCRLVEVYRCFKVVCCQVVILRRQVSLNCRYPSTNLHGVTSQKEVMFVSKHVAKSKAISVSHINVC